jgi:hypothetical protein
VYTDTCAIIPVSGSPPNSAAAAGGNRAVGAPYRAEIVATSRFDRELPGDDDWQRALAQAKELIERYLRSGNRSEVLSTAQGVGCGFVDGDAHVLWPVT